MVHATVVHASVIHPAMPAMIHASMVHTAVPTVIVAVLHSRIHAATAAASCHVVIVVVIVMMLVMVVRVRFYGRRGCRLVPADGHGARRRLDDGHRRQGRRR